MSKFFPGHVLNFVLEGRFQLIPIEVDIVIPFFNRENWLSAAIESVLKQTHPFWKLFLVNDGSSDGSLDLARSWAQKDKRIQVLSQVNRGVSAARNLGVSKGKSPWVAFLDSDDQWKPKKLEKQVCAIMEQPKLLFFHCDEIWIRLGVRVNPHKKHKKMGGQIFENCLPLCCISPSASLVHRNLLEELGGFREDFPVCEDYDLWLKVTEANTIGYVDEALITKNGGHEDQLSQSRHSMDHFRCISLITVLERNQINTQQKRAVLNTLQKKIQILCKGARRHQNLNHYDLWFGWQQFIESAGG